MLQPRHQNQNKSMKEASRRTRHAQFSGSRSRMLHVLFSLSMSPRISNPCYFAACCPSEPGHPPDIHLAKVLLTRRLLNQVVHLALNRQLQGGNAAHTKQLTIEATCK